MKKAVALLVISLIFFISVIFLYSCNIERNNMNENKTFTKYDSLLPYNGKKVSIRGKYVKHNLMPKLKADYVLYLSGILMEKDTVPKIFLEQDRSVEEQDSLNGKIVEVVGVFHLEQPLRTGDPEYIAKIKGSWIYNIEKLNVID